MRSLAALRDDKVAGRVGAKKEERKRRLRRLFLSSFFAHPLPKRSFVIPQRSKESALITPTDNCDPSTASHCGAVSFRSEARNLPSLHRLIIVALPLLVTAAQCFGDRFKRLLLVHGPKARRINS